MIPRLLDLLETPRTAEDLAARLGVPLPVVEGMLRLLEGRGYVGPAYDSSPACETACGRCGMKRLCPARGEEAPFLKVWRATGRGAPRAEAGPVRPG